MSESSFSVTMQYWSKKREEYVTVDKITDAEHVTIFGASLTQAEIDKLKSLGFLYSVPGQTKKGVSFVRYQKNAPIDKRQDFRSQLGL